MSRTNPSSSRRGRRRRRKRWKEISSAIGLHSFVWSPSFSSLLNTRYDPSLLIFPIHVSRLEFSENPSSAHDEGASLLLHVPIGSGRTLRGYANSKERLERRCHLLNYVNACLLIPNDALRSFLLIVIFFSLLFFFSVFYLSPVLI